ncbi:hypothetical protein JDV02_009991 [Purpureocillium takamizusanense]|uniref:5-Methylcytosine G/T mismatch-specific DNA glycosylase n=1 Tax=Purpureocillium takamizusanense TaxID=2060973 RepID=A0A9Q8QR51_9HYPO|nr:uncharacterized protein JDV02_009991 [Purpureocillium takamizusanense]UNI24225.1 hypothetical protein JDV02_009991 [Purpureocillium takamizusanense]
MPSKDRDAAAVDAAAAASVAGADDVPRDKARRSKSERKPDKDREHRHHRSSKSRSKLGGEGGSDLHSHVSSPAKRHRKKDKDRDDARERSASTSDLAPGVSRISLERPRISLPYPTFSKAHSKEAVHSREDLSGKQSSHPLTPEPTDAGDEERRSKSAELPRKSSTSKKSSRPPSPPETDVAAHKRRSERPPRDDDPASPASRSGSRTDDKASKVSRKSGSSSQATYIKSPKLRAHEKLRPSGSVRSSSSRHSIKRTDSTRSSSRRHEPRDDESSPSSVQDSSPKTPTPSTQFPLYGNVKNEPSSTPDVGHHDYPSKTATPASAAPAPPPPPPPPPPAVDIQDIPRVDYLLQNGGLSYPVPRHFLSVLPPQNGSRPSNPPLAGAETLFAPFFNLLEQYSTVLSKQGSIAVATGHRSVARRLLDRLENVFSRDLPPHGCTCVMCDRSHEVHGGLTWGDVLEWVSGRIELPQWPPFDLAEISLKAAEISAEAPPRPSSPVQMDPDIAEEFREHYLRQSKKVRSAVDKWLNKTGEAPVPPPQEVDDETLAFAILTNLDAEDRPFFNALLTGSRELKSSTRAPTPGNRPRSDFVVKCGLSLQRLYRLQQAPRDAECVTYLVKNPHTHDLLVTISNINKSEWEILTSGRFDGFLWSGADADDFAAGVESRGGTPVFGRSTMSPGPRGPSAMGSRNTTPFSPYSRGATPASFISLASSGLPGGRQPVSNDEEMEMAAAAEIEREIYAGMEILEDAFEKLHHKAEMVRTALRQRGAGLMQNFQSRQRIDVLPNPGSANSQGSGYERPGWATATTAGSEADGGNSEEEWFDDVDIMPDDSASNISSSRHRRPKRRTERRTPAPIEEDDEE